MPDGAAAFDGVCECNAIPRRCAGTPKSKKDAKTLIYAIKYIILFLWLLNDLPAPHSFYNYYIYAGGQ